MSGQHLAQINVARLLAPIDAPETAEEREGIVANVVFPTAIETIGGVRYVFYGMADAKIGVARLDHTAPEPTAPSANQ